MRWFSHRTCLGWRTAYPGNRRLMTWSTLRSSCTIWTSVHQAARYAVACRPILFCGVTTSPAWCPSSRSARTSSRAMTRCPPSANGGLDVTTAIVATLAWLPVSRNQPHHHAEKPAVLGAVFEHRHEAGRRRDAQHVDVVGREVRVVLVRHAVGHLDLEGLLRAG